VSVGATVYSSSSSFKELFRMADECLYVAKNNGRNRVEFSDPNRVCLTLGASPFLQRHHASAEQIDASAAIHGTLEGLQFVDLPFGLPVAPRL